MRRIHVVCESFALLGALLTCGGLQGATGNAKEQDRGAALSRLGEAADFAALPDFEKVTGESLPRSRATCAILCVAPADLKVDFDQIDHEVAKYVTFQLHAHGIKVIPPDRVRAWLKKNPDRVRTEEVGEALGASYVLQIDLSKFGLYERGDARLYRGCASGWVRVVKMEEDGNGKAIFRKELKDLYPRRAPRETSECSLPTFRKEYLSHLSEEIGEMFYEKDSHLMHLDRKTLWRRVSQVGVVRSARPAFESLGLAAASCSGRPCDR